MQAKYYDLFAVYRGSHVWNMNTTDSDIDLTLVYLMDTTDLLKGYRLSETRPDKKDTDSTGRPIECQFIELQHLINQLLKGNVNAIWIACSPIQYKIYDNNVGLLNKLRDITTRTISKSSYNSINGLVYSNLSDVTKRRTVMPTGKSLKQAYRTAQFGITLLTDHKIEFKPVTHQPTEQDISEKLNELSIAYEHSTLPETVDDMEYRQLLYHERMKHLIY